MEQLVALAQSGSRDSRRPVSGCLWVANRPRASGERVELIAGKPPFMVCAKLALMSRTKPGHKERCMSLDSVRCARAAIPSPNK